MGKRALQAEELARAKALWQEMVGTKPCGRETGINGGAKSIIVAGVERRRRRV